MAVNEIQQAYHDQLMAEISARAQMEYKATREARTWVKRTGLYHCGNCGRVPICVDIRDLGVCPYCETIKQYYDIDEEQRGVPLWNEEEKQRREVWI